MEELTQEQKDQLLNLIGEYTGATLGPLVGEVVAEQLGKLQTTQSTNLATMVAEIAGRSAVAPTEADKGRMFGRLCRAMAASKGDPEGALAFAKKHWDEKDPVVDVFEKALAAGDAVGGGFIVPPGYTEQIIELLRPNVIVRNLGAATMPMPNGSLQIPTLTAGSAANYIGENQDITESQPQFGLLMATAKKLATLVPIGNDLVRYSRPGADAVVRDDVLRAMSTKEDSTFIRALGSQFSPKGLRYWATANNVLGMTGTDILADITTDLGLLILALVDKNVALIRPGWMLAPRTWNRLMTIRDTNGQFVFRDEMLQGRLWGYPFGVTTQIPINLGGGTNESEIYFVDFADVVIAEALSLQVDVSDVAAYISSGTLVSAFSRDQTVIRVIAEHDLVVRHEESVAVITDITWGA